jgi:hypothetical protein
VPTLHTIATPSRRTTDSPGNARAARGLRRSWFDYAGVDDSLGLAAVQIAQRFRHPDSRQRPDVDWLCLLEEIGDIASGDGVAGQPGFQPTQLQGGQHYQRRDKGHKQ